MHHPSHAYVVGIVGGASPEPRVRSRDGRGCITRTNACLRTMRSTKAPTSPMYWRDRRHASTSLVLVWCLLMLPIRILVAPSSADLPQYTTSCTYGRGHTLPALGHEPYSRWHKSSLLVTRRKALLLAAAASASALALAARVRAVLPTTRTDFCSSFSADSTPPVLACATLDPHQARRETQLTDQGNKSSIYHNPVRWQQRNTTSHVSEQRLCHTTLSPCTTYAPPVRSSPLPCITMAPYLASGPCLARCPR